jgi:hypothetical protein
MIWITSISSLLHGQSEYGVYVGRGVILRKYRVRSIMGVILYVVSFPTAHQYSLTTISIVGIEGHDQVYLNELSSLRSMINSFIHKECNSCTDAYYAIVKTWSLTESLEMCLILCWAFQYVRLGGIESLFICETLSYKAELCATTSSCIDFDL